MQLQLNLQNRFFFLKKKTIFCKPNPIYFLVVLNFKLNLFKKFASKKINNSRSAVGLLKVKKYKGKFLPGFNMVLV